MKVLKFRDPKDGRCWVIKYKDAGRRQQKLMAQGVSLFTLIVPAQIKKDDTVIFQGFITTKEDADFIAAAYKKNPLPCPRSWKKANVQMKIIREKFSSGYAQ